MRGTIGRVVEGLWLRWRAVRVATVTSLDYDDALALLRCNYSEEEIYKLCLRTKNRDR